MAPGQRFRFEQWAPRLAGDHGIDAGLGPVRIPAADRDPLPARAHLAKALWVARFPAAVQGRSAARDYDGVLLFREAALIGPAIYERLFAPGPASRSFSISMMRSGQPAQFTGQRPVLPASLLREDVTGFAALRARCCRATNSSRTMRGSGTANVFVMPTSIELDDYPLSPEPAADRPFVVCWTGSTTTLAHFEHARPALETAGRPTADRVKVICNKPPERPIAGAEIVFVPWAQEGEAGEVGACHVGIMPLPDDEAPRQVRIEGAAVHGHRATGGDLAGRDEPGTNPGRQEWIPGKG